MAAASRHRGELVSDKQVQKWPGTTLKSSLDERDASNLAVLDMKTDTKRCAMRGRLTATLVIGASL